MYESIVVELKDTPNYWCEVNLFGNIVNVEFSYNTLTNKRLIKLTNYDNNVIFLKPSYITFGDQLQLNFSFQIYDMNVFVALENLKNYESDDYLNWSKNYRLLFVKYDKRTFSPPTRVMDSD